MQSLSNYIIFSRVLRDSMTLYVGRSVGLFSRIFGITAPAHPHAISVAVYTALFIY